MRDKLVWKVDAPPTGRYRSFSKRGWPSAEFGKDENIAFKIYCEDAYRPVDVKTGNHGVLSLHVADYSDHKTSFTWKRFKKEFSRLEDAKKFANNYYENHPEVFTNNPNGSKH